MEWIGDLDRSLWFFKLPLEQYSFSCSEVCKEVLDFSCFSSNDNVRSSDHVKVGEQTFNRIPKLSLWIGCRLIVVQSCNCCPDCGSCSFQDVLGSKTVYVLPKLDPCFLTVANCPICIQGKDCLKKPTIRNAPLTDMLQVLLVEPHSHFHHLFTLVSPITFPESPSR